jgi:hypothetical protein
MIDLSDSYWQMLKKTDFSRYHVEYMKQHKFINIVADLTPMTQHERRTFMRHKSIDYQRDMDYLSGLLLTRQNHRQIMETLKHLKEYYFKFSYKNLTEIELVEDWLLSLDSSKSVSGS